MRPRLADYQQQTPIDKVRLSALHNLGTTGPRKCKPRGKPFPKGSSGHPPGTARVGNGFKPGQSGNPKGRPLGTSTKEKRRIAIAKSGLTPLEFLLSVVRDVEVHLDYRLDAARAAAQYCHRKMPIAIEGGDPDKPIIFEASALTQLAPAEKLILLTLIEKMALPLPDPRKAIIDVVAKKEADSDDTGEDDANAD